MFIASETAAFSRYTSNYISLNDGELAVLCIDDNGREQLRLEKIFDFDSLSSTSSSLHSSRIERAQDEVIELSPAPYPHWTIKEILEQPEAIARALGHGGRFLCDEAEQSMRFRVKLGGLDQNRASMLSVRHLVMAACGTSYFAAMYGALLFRSLRAFDTVQTFDAAEVTPESFPLHGGGMLVISQSGETKDSHRALVQAQSLGMPSFSIVNQVGSMIARTTQCGVYLNAGREHAVASTKAFTTQVTALTLMAGWFAQNRELESDDGLVVSCFIQFLSHTVSTLS